MIAKILTWLLATFFLTTAPHAESQQPSKMPRIGVMVTAESGLEELRQGLRERGYVEGKNIEIVHREAQGNTDRMPKLVAELLEHKVDVLMTFSILDC